MKCKLCGVEIYPFVDAMLPKLCKDCFKDCDCAGLEKL
jgi:hypothetical protein